MSATVRAWHFVGDRLLDSRPVPKDGELLRFDCQPIPCRQGLHASEHPFDALQYAHGNTLCLVECGGIIVPHGDPVDKIACQERTIIVRMDAEPLLRYFARQQALSVIHLWDAPQVVIDYLMGDDAACAASSAAAWDAACAASSAAACAAAWAASRDAACAASRDAACAAAWAASRDAACAASRDHFNALVLDAFGDWL